MQGMGGYGGGDPWASIGGMPQLMGYGGGMGGMMGMGNEMMDYAGGNPYGQMMGYY